MKIFTPVVILTKDWEFSRGARFEVQDALDNNCEFYDVIGVPLTTKEVKSRLRETTPLP